MVLKYDLPIDLAELLDKDLYDVTICNADNVVVIYTKNNTECIFFYLSDRGVYLVDKNDKILGKKYPKDYENLKEVLDDFDAKRIKIPYLQFNEEELEDFFNAKYS